MESNCKACGGPTEYDGAAAGKVCTQCGVLEHGDAGVLDSHLAEEDWGGEYRLGGLPLQVGLKSYRRKGQGLIGQSKEARDARNTVRTVMLLFDRPSN
jgi:hypothetical protein